MDVRTLTAEALNVALKDAADQLKENESLKTSKPKSRVVKLADDVLSKVSGNTDTQKEAFSILMDQVSSFAENSRALVSILDEVGKIHPFVQGAVLVFKVGINLELARRQNDGKVLALHITMCDMMQTLTLLKQVSASNAVASDGLSIEDRLRQRMGDIIESIKSCARLCDSYKKRRTAVKVLTSFRWQDKFTDVAEQFKDHQAGLQQDLQVHVSIGIMHITDTLSDMKDMMARVFEQLQSPEERDLTAYIASKGGLKVVSSDDGLLKQVISKEKTYEDLVERRSGERGLTVYKLREEVEMEVDQILAGNKEFDQKFDAMRMKIDEVKMVVKRESDRVIDVVQAGIQGLYAGPHERIVDRDIYNVWTEMGWKGSVKARHLITALRDCYSEKSKIRTALVIRGTAKEDSSNLTSQHMDTLVTVSSTQAFRVEDEWALQYISVFRVKPLIEALDDDLSSFVTVAEVNAFTAARPARWSLPHWIAYWTVGFEMTTQWYYRRIRKVLADIQAAATIVLPANRGTVPRFQHKKSILFIEALLSGLLDVEKWDNVFWKFNEVFLKFRDYALDEEAKMEQDLKRVNYFLDDENTLTLVTTGRGRLEKYLLPIIFLLLQRALSAIRQAESVLLHQRELENIGRSILTVQNAVVKRVQSLEEVFTSNRKDELQTFFFGLYCWARDWSSHRSDSFWFRSLEDDSSMIEDERNDDASEDGHTDDKVGDVSIGRNSDTQRNDGQSQVERSDDVDSEDEHGKVPPIPALFYGPQNEDIDFLSPATEGECAESPPEDQASLRGQWSGCLTFKGDQTFDGYCTFHFSVAPSTDGIITGSGVDVDGRFTLKGTVDGSHIVFIQDFIDRQPKGDTLWRYEGDINDRMDRIDGMWGAPAAEGEQQPVGGTFYLERRPIDSLLFRPSDKDLQDNKYKSLWSFAIQAVLRTVRTRLLRWEVLKERRDVRQRYIRLARLRINDELAPRTDEGDEWEALLKTIHPDDLHLWRTIAFFQRERDAEYLHIACQNCDKEPIMTTRLICLDCWRNDRYINLCASCIEESLDHEEDSKKHTPEHALLQLRHGLFRIYERAACKDGRILIDRLKAAIPTCNDIAEATTSDSACDGKAVSVTPILCITCKKSMSVHLPIWVCVTCDDIVLVCWECNARVERERPWLFERRAPEGHSWIHTLALVPRPAPAPAQDVSMDERLQRLQAKLDQQASDFDAERQTAQTRFAEFEAAMSARMQKLEDMLARVVDGAAK